MTEVTTVHVHNYHNRRTCTLSLITINWVTAVPISSLSILVDVLGETNLWSLEQALRHAVAYGDYEQAAEWLAEHLVITIGERIIGNAEYLEAVAA